MAEIQNNKDNKNIITGIRSKKQASRIQDIINNIASGMDKLYKSTYMASPLNSKDLDNVKTSFNKSLDKILNNNYNNNGDTNLSKLFARGPGKNNENNFVDIFEDKQFTDSLISDFTESKQLKELDDEIDQILNFMPMLNDALDAKKDNVLSADNFARDYLNVLDDANTVDEEFNKNIDQIKEEYDLLELSEYCYDMASKYGEAFIYIESYNDALFKLLRNKPNLLQQQNESYGKPYRSENIICESINMNTFLEQNELGNLSGFFNENVNILVEMNTSGSIESAVIGAERAKKVKKKTNNSTQRIIPNDISFEGLGSEGLMNFKDKDKEEQEKNNLKLNGSIIKKLPRANVIPIYIDDMVLGFYYIECDTEVIMNAGTNGRHNSMLYCGHKTLQTQQKILQQEQREKLLKTLSSNLSAYIDANFINANQDLKEEIYMVLKHNDMFNGNNINKIKVTFIPPENMIHYYFKLDPVSHRGISDLQNALLPAKIFVYLYLNDTIGNLTRSQDKRMYSVKNNVDTNISQVLLNTINQLKRGNMGARELTSMKTMLNITGRYNDVIIPVGPSGESPIDFQVMEGQNIETKTDLMEMMQEMAVNATDVPYDYVQSRKAADYAVRLTMSSSKFLRKTFKRQAIVQKHLSNLITKLYINEFNEDCTLTVLLPPPAFLQILNTNQLYESITQQVELILTMRLSDDDDPRLRQKLKMKLYDHYMKGYVDMDMIDRLEKECRMEFAAEKGKDDE